MGLKLKLFGKKHWNPWISCISRMKCWFTKLCYYLVRRAVRMLQRCNAWNPRISAWNAQMGDEIHWNPFYYSLLFFPIHKHFIVIGYFDLAVQLTSSFTNLYCTLFQIYLLTREVMKHRAYHSWQLVFRNPHEIRRISCEICMKSTKFHVKSAQNPPDFMNVSFWVITKYRSFFRKTNKFHIIVHKVHVEFTLDFTWWLECMYE